MSEFISLQEMRDFDEYDRVIKILKRENINELEALRAEIQSFPAGMDPIFEHHWLISTVAFGLVDATKWMLNQVGVDPNHRESDGETALSAAIDIEDPITRYKLLRCLLANGADPNRENRYRSASHQAAIRGDLEAMKILLEYGADICAKIDDLGLAAPLDLVDAEKNPELISFLSSVCKNT